MTGKWISVDGCEGAGKTTMVNMLRDRYKTPIFIPEFPSEMPGDYLKEIVKSRPYVISDAYIGGSLLFISDYFYIVETKIIPLLKENRIVVTDRGFLSKITLQAAVMSEKYPFEDVAQALNALFRLSIKPSLTLYLETDMDIAVKRIKQRDGDCSEERIHYMEKTRELSNYFIREFNLTIKNLKSESDVKACVEDLDLF